MSDFLRHLVGRELGTETGLRPRLPSLFETGVVPAAALGEDTLEHEAASRPASPMPVSAANPAPAQPGPTPTPTPVRSMPSVAPPPVPPPLVTAMPSTPSHGRQPELRSSVSRADAQLVEGTQAAHRPNEHAPAQAPVRPMRARIAAAATTPGSAETKPEKSVGQAPPSGPPTMAAPLRPMPVPPPAPVPMPKPVREPARRVEPSPTVVQVSIGRIEVRAAPSPPASKERREGPRPAALEDYLRDRNGRGGG